MSWKAPQNRIANPEFSDGVRAGNARSVGVGEFVGVRYDAAEVPCFVGTACPCIYQTYGDFLYFVAQITRICDDNVRNTARVYLCCVFVFSFEFSVLMMCSWKKGPRRFSSVECLPAKIFVSSRSWESQTVFQLDEDKRNHIRRATV